MKIKRIIIILISIIVTLCLCSCLYNGAPPSADKSDGISIDELVSDSEEQTENEEQFEEESGEIDDEEVFYTVSFNTDGGTAIASQTVKEGEKATMPSTPEKKIVTATKVEFYEFAGWYVGDDEYDFQTEISEDLTIDAKWDLKDSYTGNLHIRR